MMNDKDATVVGFSDYALDGNKLNDDEFAHLSLFHRAKQIGFDIVHDSSACHHSKLYPHQNAAVRAVIRYQKDPAAFEATKKESVKKLPCIADDGDGTDDDEETPTKKKPKKSALKPSKGTFGESTAKLGYALPHQEHARRVNVNMRITPAGGKTWILVHVAMRCGFRVLLVTNSKENANQALVDVLKNTRIAEFADVMLIRPMENSKEEIGNDDKFVDVDFDAKYANHILSSKPNHKWNEFSKYKQLLDRGGLIIVDAYMIKSHESASKERKDMQKLIYRTTWDVLLVDETDTTATKQWRSAVTDGISRSEWPKWEQQKFVLDYALAVYVSGTWYRSDREGDEFLENNCGSNLLTVPSRTVEDKNMLATSIYNVIVCDRQLGVDDNIDILLSKMSGTINQRVRLLTPSKLRIIFELVHFYSLFNMKIILFTKRKAHAALLTSIFKGCHAVDGSYKKGSCERERIAAEFCNYGTDFSNVLVTTSVFSIGKDMRPCQVVIQCCAVGESCRQLRQRTARNHRLDPLVSRDAATPKQCMSFDILDPIENEWASGLLKGAATGIVDGKHSVFDQDRYQLLIEDGYADRMRVMSSSQLKYCLSREKSQHFPNSDQALNPFDEKLFVDYALFVLAILNPSLEIQMKVDFTATSPGFRGAPQKKRKPARSGNKARLNKLLKSDTAGKVPITCRASAPPLQSSDAKKRDAGTVVLSSGASSSTSIVVREPAAATTTPRAASIVSELDCFAAAEVLCDGERLDYKELLGYFEESRVSIEALIDMNSSAMKSSRLANVAAAKGSGVVLQALSKHDLSEWLRI